MSEKPAWTQFVLMETAGTPAESRDVRNSRDANNSIPLSKQQER